jgi:hypothetical protein
MGCQCPKDRNPIRFSSALMPDQAFSPVQLFPCGERDGRDAE